MVKNKFRLKNNKLYIYPLSDLHLGSPNCDLEYFSYWCELFDQNRSKNKVIYLLGDLIDMQSLRIGAFEQDLSADEQVVQLVDLLKPYKKYINYMTIGNHGRRPKKDYNLDIGRIVSEILGVKYNKSDFFDTLRINNKDFIVYGKHGSKFNQRLELAEGAFIRDTHQLQADMFIQGHNHYISYFNRPIRTKNGIKRRHYIFSGHFLEYNGSYANEKNLTQVPQGFVRLAIDKKLNVSAQEYHKDIIFGENKM